MDLFMVDNNRSSISLPIMLAFAGVSLFTLYGLSRLLRFQEQEDNDDDKNVQQSKSPVGIYNEGNTCFVNSLIQTLASLTSFQKLLDKTAKSFRGKLNQNQQLIVELASVLQQINEASQSISVTPLLKAIESAKHDLINLEQQDAHQLYTTIISCVESTLDRQKKLDLSASQKFQEEEEEFENPLIGYLKSSTTCTSCKLQTSVRIDPFYDLSLDITKPYVFNVMAALREFQRQQTIDQWICSNCSVRNHCYRLKQVLRHLRGKNKQKLTFIGSAIIEFLQNENLEQHEIKEVNIKLQNFVTTFTKQYQQMQNDEQRDKVFIEMQGKESSILKRAVITKYPKILVIHMKQLVINPYSGEAMLLRKHLDFDQTLKIDVRKRIDKYQLTGLLTHIGNESFGHYLSCRRLNSQADQWFIMNDSQSKKVPWEFVRRTKAYMLFYEIIQ